jgi:CMP/dCMP kinase
MSIPFQIAIDGPVAAGKGSVSLRLSQVLGFLYVETGAMYRVAAYLALQQGTPLTQEKEIVDLVKQHTITMRLPTPEEADGRFTTVVLDGEDVSWKIRTEEVSLAASRVAVLESLRTELVRQQRLIANSHNVVMEGRDIGTKVLPDAQLKIYLDAQLDTRVERKHKQLLSQGEQTSKEDVRLHIIDRDTRELTRTIDPLRPAVGGWVVDSTDFSVEEIVEQIRLRVEAIQKQ